MIVRSRRLLRLVRRNTQLHMNVTVTRRNVKTQLRLHRGASLALRRSASTRPAMSHARRRQHGALRHRDPQCEWQAGAAAASSWPRIDVEADGGIEAQGGIRCSGSKLQHYPKVSDPVEPRLSRKYLLKFVNYECVISTTQIVKLNFKLFCR